VGGRKHAEAAIAAAIPLLLGYRAAEVVDRQVRDLDDGGSVLRIPVTKSQAGIRSQKLPEWFRPLIASRTEGKDNKKAAENSGFRDSLWS
jgi:hypothetical protein